MPFNNNTTYNFNSTWKEIPAVYGILNAQKQLIYVGQTDNLRRRMDEHCCDTQHLMHKYKPAFLIAEIVRDKTLRVNRERQLINEYNPPCNQC